MSDLFMISLLLCACAGIISEIITITVPEKIVDITQQDPEELIQKKFYKFIFALSALYMLVVILLIFSGNNRFRLYAVVILCISIFGWLFRAKLKKHIYIIVAESTVCIIMLIDIVRTIISEIML